MARFWLPIISIWFQSWASSPRRSNSILNGRVIRGLLNLIGRNENAVCGWRNFEQGNGQKLQQQKRK